jgi:hypothetical protein
MPCNTYIWLFVYSLMIISLIGQWIGKCVVDQSGLIIFSHWKLIYYGRKVVSTTNNYLFKDAIFSSYCQRFVDFFQKITFWRKISFEKLGYLKIIQLTSKILWYYDIIVIIKIVL